MHYQFYQRLDLHVGASDRAVIRATLSRIEKRDRYALAKRAERHDFIRKVLAEHREARTEYIEVMHGYTPSPTRDQASRATL